MIFEKLEVTVDSFNRIVTGCQFIFKFSKCKDANKI